jgi:carbon storage regulator CsrA
MENGWSSTEYRHPIRTAHVLILTRRLGQSLVFGPSIRVTVVGIRGNQVRIGIEAPKSVRVHREELYERMQRDERTLSGSSKAMTVVARNQRTDDSRESRIRSR